MLNHTTGKPVGIFTAIAEQRSLYSHGAMIVILNRKWGRLPVVVDIHERGIRAVPLHHFLGPKVLAYGEIYRMVQRPTEMLVRLQKAFELLTSEEHPYDLTGSEDRKALSCVETLSYIFELAGEQKIEIRSRIQDAIYANILRFGRLDYQYMQMPNDVLLDERFEFLGYIDNVQSIEHQVSNEIFLDLFREKMMQKKVKTRKDLARFFGEIAIDQIRNERSFLGGFLLGVTGFNRENFPAGDKGLLAAVNAIEHVFNKAMTRCLSADRFGKSTLCRRVLQISAGQGAAAYDYSIHRWKSEWKLRSAADKELTEFEQMFE